MDKNVDKTKREFMKRFAEAIDNSGVPQAKIAEKLGVTDVTVCRWRAGIRKPKGEYLGMFCRIVGVSPEWLLWGTKPKAKIFCPYCGERLSEPKPEIDHGEVVSIVGNKEEIASLMDENEFNEFCKIWREKQKNFFEKEK